MFKSCDYCRHRKKRCVVEGEAARCADCEHLDLPCEFSQRRPSLKRRQTSRHIAARLGLQARGERGETSPLGMLNEGGGVFASDAGRRRVQVDSRSGMINKTLLERQGARGTTTTAEVVNNGLQIKQSPLYERYVHDVKPFLPFVPDDMFDGLEDEEGSLLADCVTRACALSLNMVHAQSAGDATALDEAVDTKESLCLADTAGLLLLIPCMPLASTTVDKVLHTIQREYQHQHQHQPLPLPIAAGAISAHTWRQLVGLPTTLSETLPLLQGQPANVLHTYALSLDEQSFARHYLLLADIAARFRQECIRTEAEGVVRSDDNNDNNNDSLRLAWAKLEYECLLWQVRLPPHLLDLRDELPATPESLVMHQLSSLVLLSLYGYILLSSHADTLGSLVALRPVPGVLYFMCALARSVFICPHAVLARWDLIVDIRAATARILLRLWHQTRFENCRAILALWSGGRGDEEGEPDGVRAEDERYRDLAAQVREEIGTGPWTVDEIDGYSVFWTYRDLRALTLELICGDQRYSSTGT